MSYFKCKLLKAVYKLHQNRISCLIILVHSCNQLALENTCIIWYPYDVSCNKIHKGHDAKVSYNGITVDND